jgi:S-adenosylmethionine hydrolase
MARPIIAFLTDFGVRDHYVGAMKGAALQICPEATLVDITHDIAPQDILGGALELAGAYRYFPPETVFVAVVDPGVGSSRRGLGADTGAYRFVAPDNGILSGVFREAPPTRVVELTEPAYRRAVVSRTFEARDRFAPAAAWLASGTALTALGPSIGDYHVLAFPEPVQAGSTLQGLVVRVDRFGNLVTNITRQTFERFTSAASVEIAVDNVRIPALVDTYAEVAPGDTCALFGSSDALEIASNGDSAARRLGAQRGSKVVVDKPRVP